MVDYWRSVCCGAKVITHGDSDTIKHVCMDCEKECEIRQ